MLSSISWILVALIALFTHSAAAQYAPIMNWPLCGYDTENENEPHLYRMNSSTTSFPSDWTAQDGCPANRRGSSADVHVPMDGPIRSTYGPRPLVSGAERYDFHRGIDIPCIKGAPMFAIADGEVRKAGSYSSYSDPVIIIRHLRPGHNSCGSGDGCYHSVYMHARKDSDGGCCEVTSGDDVSAGDLIGYCGDSDTGFQHLHFEIRDAEAGDIYSAWSKDAVHPLAVLPYESSGDVAIQIEVDNRDSLNPLVVTTLEVNTTTGMRHNIVGVSITLFDSDDNEIVQPGNTPNAKGYLVHPSSFHMSDWNRQFSHKNSGSIPWSSFDSGGARECPYHAAHGVGYDANIHMDAADPENFRVGLFNGVRVALQPYAYYGGGGYFLNVSFEELMIAEDVQLSRVQSKILFADGSESTSVWDAATVLPTDQPSEPPTQPPTVTTSIQPTPTPSFSPSHEPTSSPQYAPTVAPTDSPSCAPTTKPSEQPTSGPSAVPSTPPTSAPSTRAPTTTPTDSPTDAPSAAPTPCSKSGCDACTGGNDLTALTFRYTGDGLHANHQILFASIEGTTEGVSIVNIEFQSRNKQTVLYFSNVQVGESVTIAAADMLELHLYGCIYIKVYDSNDVASVASTECDAVMCTQLHVSCGALPLVLGDIFGGLEFSGFEDIRGGTEESCPCAAEVTDRRRKSLKEVKKPYSNAPVQKQDARSRRAAGTGMSQRKTHSANIAWMLAALVVAFVAAGAMLYMSALTSHAASTCPASGSTTDPGGLTSHASALLIPEVVVIDE
eukprot:m.42027 g.42027  ORF g.42027 m.42027 type:complete len:780 (+) comp14992_c0_seq3:192-2531(+)